MPIYSYKCASCGFSKEVLQKLSDRPLTVCPSCGADSFSKQVTAAGFRLKGSGWYVTDFRNEGGAATAKPADAGKGATDGTGHEHAHATHAHAGSAAEGKSGEASAPAPAPAPAAAATPAPAAAASPGSTGK